MRTNEARFPAAVRQQGFTLFEVLVAIVVLAVGLLGLAGLQLLGLRGNTDSYVRSQAAILVNDLAERMHINLRGVDQANGYSNIDIDAVADCTAATNCETAQCTANQMALYDACQIFIQAGGLFRVSRLQVQCDDNDTTDFDACTDGSPHNVTLRWVEVGPGGNDVSQTILLRFQP